MDMDNGQFVGFVEGCERFDLYVRWSDDLGEYRRYLTIYEASTVYPDPHLMYPEFIVRMAYAMAQEVANEFGTPVNLTVDGQLGRAGSWVEGTHVASFTPRTSRGKPVETRQNRGFGHFPHLDDLHYWSGGPNVHSIQVGYRGLPMYSALDHYGEAANVMFRSGRVQIPIRMNEHQFEEIRRFCAPPLNWSASQIVRDLRRLCRRLETDLPHMRWDIKRMIESTIAEEYLKRLLPGMTLSEIRKKGDYPSDLYLDRLLLLIEDRQPGSFLPEEVVAAELQTTLRREWNYGTKSDDHPANWKRVKKHLAKRYGPEEAKRILRRFRVRKQLATNSPKGSTDLDNSDED